MSEKLYRVCWQIEGEEEIERGSPVSKDLAQFAADEGNQAWGDMIRHWIEPVPDWTPPTVTRIPLERTMMGSPCSDDDLLGVKPPC